MMRKTFRLNRKSREWLHRSGAFNYLDLHFAAMMARLEGREEPDIFLAAAMISRGIREGHVCIDPAIYAGKSLPLDAEGKTTLQYPDPETWRKRLTESPVVGRPGDDAPIIQDASGRLYLHRYWSYQERVAVSLTNRVQGWQHDFDPAILKNRLSTIFPDSEGNEPDWQKVVACLAVLKPVCILAGGPGTGKTTTIAKMIVLLIEAAGLDPDRIALTAPTGKAADRMRSALRSAKDRLLCPEALKTAIPETASTLHRLLGAIQGSSYFRHGADRPLAVDAVIVDEASMVDLALAAKLLDALPSECRLILVGDPYQLASVEAGAVLGDICAGADGNCFSSDLADKLTAFGAPVTACRNVERPDPVSDCVITLQKNYRFESGTDLGEMCRMIKTGHSQAAAAVASGYTDGSIMWLPLPEPAGFAESLQEHIINEFDVLTNAKSPGEALAILERSRILCAVREGPYGVSAVNRIAERILASAGFINLRQTWYPGRPIMITANDYALNLYNGDVGVTMRDPDGSDDFFVYFSSGSSHDEERVRKFHTDRIGQHETVYAMTLHKSQGSEFDTVLLILPNQDMPILSRELIYTGITRARKAVTIWADRKILAASLDRPAERHSGLRDALRFHGAV